MARESAGRWIGAVAAAVLVCAPVAFPVAGVAQESGDGSDAGADTAFRYEREVFAYPDGGRTNPFRPPEAGGAMGPRFEDLRLSGILYAPSVGSVAVLRDAATGRVHRVREGDRLGEARLVAVRPSEAVFAVTGPTGARTKLLRVKRDERRKP